MCLEQPDTPVKLLAKVLDDLQGGNLAGTCVFNVMCYSRFVSCAGLCCHAGRSAYELDSFHLKFYTPTSLPSASTVEWIITMYFILKTLQTEFGHLAIMAALLK